RHPESRAARGRPRRRADRRGGTQGAPGPGDRSAAESVATPRAAPLRFAQRNPLRYIGSMPLATATKIRALRRDFKTGAAIADLLGVNRSPVTRWLRGAGIDPLNAERTDLPQLARFRGSVMVPQVLLRRGLPLALAALELDDRAKLVDLDDPGVLAARRLRPSHVATRQRSVTQPQALALYRGGAAGLRWWSTFE